MDDKSLQNILIMMGIKPSPFVNVDVDKESFTDDFGNRIVNVHIEDDCGGKCTIHNHSVHSLSSFPLLWRNDRKIFEHICSHGVGHPCPDSLRYDSGVHGCCGCCRSNNES